MDMLGWVAIGLVVGALAGLLPSARRTGGGVAAILLGIAGALLAGFLGRLTGFYGPGARAGYAVAAVGAFALLAISRTLRKL